MTTTSPSALPTTMKASLVTKYGTNFAETYKYVEDFPMPALPLKADEILVEIKAAGVNPVDYKMASGHYSLVMPIKQFPYIVGNDGAGSVVAIGSAVKKFKIGDQGMF